MAVIITPPLSAPINLTASVSAGGTLVANTTYYWKVLATNSSNTNYLNVDLKRSDFSAEGSFTATATNKQCLLQWDAVTGATHYVIILTKTSGDYVNPFRVGTTSASTSTNSYTITSEPAHGYCTWETIDPVANPMPGGIARKGGRILIDFYGNETLTSIYNAVVAAGYSNYISWDGYTFVLNGSFVITGTNTGSLSVLGVHMILLGFFHNPQGTNVTVTFGFSTINSYMFQSCLTMLYQTVGSKWDKKMIFNGGEIRAVLGKSGPTQVWGDGRCFGEALFNNTYINENFVTAVDGTTLSNAKLTQLLVDIVPTFKMWDCEFTGYSGLPFYLGGGGATNPSVFDKIYRIKFNALYDMDTRIANSSVKTTTGTMIDCEFPFRAGNSPKIFFREFAGTNPYWMVLYFKYSLLAKIQDKNGNVISGATVKLNDALGNTITYTANNSGYLVDDKITLTASTTTVLTDSSKNWTVNDHAGKELVITSGVNAGLKVVIASNTSNALTLQKTLSTACAIGDTCGTLVYLPSFDITRDPATVGQGDLYSPAGELRHTNSPYTITISASGYQTKVVNLNLNKKQDLVITLERQVPFIHTLDDKTIVNLSPTKAVNQEEWAEV